MTDVSLPRLRTPGIIAHRLGVSLQRVQYVLQTRPHIRPTALAGRLRLYDQHAVAMIRHELTAIDARRLQRQARREKLDLHIAVDLNPAKGVARDA